MSIEIHDCIDVETGEIADPSSLDFSQGSRWFAVWNFNGLQYQRNFTVLDFCPKSLYMEGRRVDTVYVRDDDTDEVYHIPTRLIFSIGSR